MHDHPPGRQGFHATTIVMVKKGGRTVFSCDGRVSIGQTPGNAKTGLRTGKQVKA